MTIEDALERIRQLYDNLMSDDYEDAAYSYRTEIKAMETEIAKAYNRMKDKVTELEKTRDEDRKIVLALSKAVLKPGTWEDLELEKQTLPLTKGE